MPIHSFVPSFCIHYVPNPEDVKVNNTRSLPSIWSQKNIQKLVIHTIRQVPKQKSLEAREGVSNATQRAPSRKEHSEGLNPMTTC